MPSRNEELLELAMRRAVDGRGELAASIAETCLSPDAGLNEAELALTFDIVRILVESVEVNIRRHLAAYLAERDDVPADLLAFLANDHISVAYPILVHSRILHDDELINVVARRTKQHRLAISIRPQVSEAVCDALIRSGDPEVIESLLYNDGASIRPQTLDVIVTSSRPLRAFHPPLAHRRDLTADQARRLYRWVGDALRGHIAAHFDIAPTVVDAATEDAVAKAFRQEKPAPGVAAEAAAALIAALRRGDRHGVEVHFTACAGLDPASASKILYGRSVRALAVACKASGLSVVVFGDLLSQARDGNEFGGTTQSENQARAMTYYDRLDNALARATLEKWRDSPSSIWRDDKS